jgi:hypothetical protein
MTRLRVLEQQLAQRVSDLLATAVAHRDVDRQSGSITGPSRRAGQPLRHLRRQEIQRTDDPHSPRRVRRAQLVDDISDDLQQEFHLIRWPVAQVIRRQQPERRDLDTAVLAPVEQLDQLGGTDPVTVTDVGKPRLLGPAAITIHDHRDMAGAVGAAQPAG